MKVILTHHSVLCNTNGHCTLKNRKKYAVKEKTGFSGSVGMEIMGDLHRFFCGYGMGMGIEIQSRGRPENLYILIRTLSVKWLKL